MNPHFQKEDKISLITEIVVILYNSGFPKKRAREELVTECGNAGWDTQIRIPLFLTFTFARPRACTRSRKNTALRNCLKNKTLSDKNNMCFKLGMLSTT